MKRILSLILAAALLCACVPAAWAADGGKPYSIRVNRAQSTVTVYERDGEGRYTVPVKAMICSTGREGHATPAGTYRIGGRWTWLHMIDGSYGQYATQISGNILFHSVCYRAKDPSTLMTEEYNGLGAPASLGCVRLQTADAKWIYDNCPRGTTVTIYDDPDDPGPLGKPDRVVDYIDPAGEAAGWDPTDPREGNPWRGILSAGEDGPAPEGPAAPEAPEPETPAPEESAAPAPEAPVQPEPAPEPPEIEEPAPEESAQPEEPEPPEPEAPALETEELEDVPADGAASYADAAQALYRLSGGGNLTTPAQMAAWAMNQRLWVGMMGQGFRCSAPITRQDLAAMLYRYEARRLRCAPWDGGPLPAFEDGEEVRDYAQDALAWAVGQGLLHAAPDNTVRPDWYVSPAQLDAVLERYGGL